MQTYSMNQWLLFFYFYSFLGWIWESCYVSFLKRKWVNRGFMHGPMLPIYGSGAVVILASTMPFSENVFLIFVVGMCAATLLEYCTGAAMEALFHVRYWDYSNQRFNLNGYICLSSTITWGFFSILMDRVIHPPIAKLLLPIPEKILELMILIITIIATVDFMQSLHEALDLRELLDKMTENNEEFAKIQARLDEMATVLNENIQEYKEQATERRIHAQERWDFVTEQKQQRVKQFLDNRKSVGDMINGYLERIEKANVSSEKKLAWEKELFDLKDRSSHLNLLSHLHTDRHIRSSLKILHRNPSSISKKYADALSELRNFDAENKSK
ncbi:MAG: hypothetical protein ACI4HI_08070 [Lachnospiraceae bacterium]